MADNQEPKSALGLILGAIVAIAAAIFLIGGGEHLGKKTVQGDEDLPPVASGLPGPPPETSGGPANSPPRPIVTPVPSR